MRQAALFDVPDPPPSMPTLPYQGSTPEAREASKIAAEQERQHRAILQNRYMQLLLRRGVVGATDHEAAEWLGVMVSSLCSTRAALRNHLTSHGHREGPAGKPNTVWVLRLAVGQAIGHGEDAA